MSHGSASFRPLFASGASSSEAGATPAMPTNTSSTASNSRSCVICRRRKVRCDKKSPCSNCRRAQIACVFPSADRPPRWVLRLEQSGFDPSDRGRPSDVNEAGLSGPPVESNGQFGAEHILHKLHLLEEQIRALSSKSKASHAATLPSSRPDDGAPSVTNPGRAQISQHQNGASLRAQSRGSKAQIGKLVRQDESNSRYVSSGFWSHIDDELGRLGVDARNLANAEPTLSSVDISPNPASATHEPYQTPVERQTLLFGHSSSPSTLGRIELRPLPSQIPFLLDTFSDNVNVFLRLVHVPTVNDMVREMRQSGKTSLEASTEALLFSIYYAAIVSMEDDEVVTNFGIGKVDLMSRYRRGFENALAEADFLNNPDLTVVQAFAIFVTLARRHDSPRFIWMMTGLLIRMAQYIGLQRDGAQSEHLTPYEVEMRRRVWWVVVFLDVRASQDQGTDIVLTEFDTKLPANINDAEIAPDIRQTPPEREGITDASFARISAEITEIQRLLLISSVTDGVAGLSEQCRLLNQVYQKFEKAYIRYTTDTDNIASWVGVVVTRLVMAKLTLLVFLPVLFSSTSAQLTHDTRAKLLIAAIEVAEYNHALNSEQRCRHWRWLYLTNTHAYAFVYIMLEASRRAWSPTIERAWIALHSKWLIPSHSHINKSFRIWIPLRQLMEKAGQHRSAELKRLRSDPQSIARLEAEDRKLPAPSSPGTFRTKVKPEFYREQWRRLVLEGREIMSEDEDPTQEFTAGQVAPTQIASTSAGSQRFSSNEKLGSLPTSTSTGPSPAQSRQSAHQPVGVDPSLSADWTNVNALEANLSPWFWTEGGSSAQALPDLEAGLLDTDMNLESDLNWYNWAETTKGIDWAALQDEDIFT